MSSARFWEISWWLGVQGWLLLGYFLILWGC